MDDDRVRDEFQRIKTAAELERKWELIASYHDGYSHALRKVRELSYDLGRLEER